MLEVAERNGVIWITPVAIYDALREEISDSKRRISTGEQPTFDTVDEMFAELDRPDK